MKFYGKTWSEYIAFLKGPLILLTVMFAVRWLLSECGLRWARYLSMTAASILIVVYLPLKIHARKFGSYPQLGVLYLLIGLWMNLLICIGILAAAMSGHENAYSMVEHLGQARGYAAHILAHLTVFTSLFVLLYFATGAVLLYLLRRFDTHS